MSHAKKCFKPGKMSSSNMNQMGLLGKICTLSFDFEVNPWEQQAIAVSISSLMMLMSLIFFLFPACAFLNLAWSKIPKVCIFNLVAWNCRACHLKVVSGVPGLNNLVLDS